MEYRNFKDIKLSVLGMGNMRLPQVDPNDGNSAIDWKEAHKVIDLAYESGINYFDTAYVYNNGESERCLGEAMKKHPRESFYLATKFNYGANHDYKAVFEEQLERLQTDHIDFYLLHCLMDSNIDDYLGCGCIEYFERMQKEGKITYFGFSSHASPETLRRFADARKWDFAQIQMNYLDWKYSTSEEEYNILTERGIPVIVMESIRGGKLSDLGPELNARLKAKHPDWSVSSWALRWLMAHDNVRVMLSGMSSLQQVKDNVETCSSLNALDSEDSSFLEDIAQRIKASLSVPCTGCRYCTSDCPMQIPIPDVLKAYNEYKYVGWGKIDLSGIPEDCMPSRCIGCNTCRSLCPQSIDIPHYMKEAASVARI